MHFSLANLSEIISECSTNIVDVGTPVLFLIPVIVKFITRFSDSRKFKRVHYYEETVRFILDNGHVVRDRRILDVGCGCGAGSIAASKMKAKSVVANDIDDFAVIATEMNAKLNDVTIGTSTTNLVGDRCTEFDTILIGDMFYDEEFANLLFGWLHTLTEDGKTVLIGDPGRHGLTARRRQSMSMVAQYQLPAHSCMENHGFTHTTVWRLNK